MLPLKIYIFINFYSGPFLIRSCGELNLALLGATYSGAIITKLEAFSTWKGTSVLCLFRYIKQGMILHGLIKVDKEMIMGHVS
jgi:hypothetical protein